MGWLLLGLMILIYLTVRIADSRSRRKKEKDEPAAEVTGGNVSVFMDKEGNIDVIPFSMDKLRRGRASDYPVRLRKSFGVSDLGMAIRRGMKRSVEGNPLDSMELMKSLGYNKWKDYSKGKRSVSVTFTDGGIVLNSTIRRGDGSYAFRIRGFEKLLPVKLSDSALGDAIYDLMKRSR